MAYRACAQIEIPREKLALHCLSKSTASRSTRRAGAQRPQHPRALPRLLLRRDRIVMARRRLVTGRDPASDRWCGASEGPRLDYFLAARARAKWRDRVTEGAWAARRQSRTRLRVARSLGV
jgi:hypothetical protein